MCAVPILVFAYFFCKFILLKQGIDCETTKILFGLSSTVITGARPVSLCPAICVEGSDSTLLTRVIVTVHVHQKPNTRRVIRQIYCPSERKRHTVASESGQSHANVGAFWSSVTTTPGIVIYQVDVGINVKCRSIVYTKIYSEYSSTE